MYNIQQIVAYFTTKNKYAYTLWDKPSKESAPTTYYFNFQYCQQISVNCTFQLLWTPNKRPAVSRISTIHS